MGPSHSWRAGISYLRTRTEDRSYAQTDLFDRDAQVGFNGASRLTIADFVWKWAPNGNVRQTNFKVQGEYFRRKESGDLTYDLDGILGVSNTSAYASRQSGWYAQGGYQVMPTGPVGARYDRLGQGSVDHGANGVYLGSNPFNSVRASGKIYWSPAEFSRL